MASDNQSFTSEMRRATRKIHSLSDSIANTKLLMALSDESVWADALLVFYEVFKCLEDLKKEMNMPELDMLYVDDALLRTAAFKTDLDRYYGKGWEGTYDKRPEVVEYLEHLRELKEERPLLILAYVYHLYMGLLSGGQIIRTKRKLREITMFSLFSNPSNSLALDYNHFDCVTEFPGSDINELKKSIKTAMNKIASQWCSEQRCALINESQMVFTYNNNIMRSVKGTNKAVLWKIFYILLAVKISFLVYYYFL